MGQRKTVLLFDADNTLLDFSKTEEFAFCETMKRHGYPCHSEIKKIYDEINHGLWKQYEREEITREQVVFTRFGKLFEQIGIDGDGVLFEQEYQDMLSRGSFVIDGAMPLLAKVRRAGCQCYIVTNGVAKTQHRRLKESGIIRYMDDVFISEELGCAKPSKLFFDKVFAAIGEQKRKNAIIIGDSLTSDILGGNYAGITACWYNPNHLVNETQAVVDYEVAHLKELYDILAVNPTDNQY